MSKYTDKQLRQMAIEALEERSTGDPRYQLLIMNLCMMTGLASGAVEYKIQVLAQDDKEG